MIATEHMNPVKTENLPDMADDDLTLVRNAKKDLAAFSALYERYATQVYRYLLVRVGDVHEAENLTSQTFMAAMKGLHTYQEQSPFPAWLLGIARNKTADLFRQRRPLSELDETVPTAESRDDVEESIDRQMVVEEVARKLKTISPERAEALTLRLFGGLEVSEIARIMEKKETAVRMLVFRGLGDLRAQMVVG